MNELDDTPEKLYATLVEAFLSSTNATQEGRGFGADALKTKGKIFAMLTRGKLVVKLPKQRVDELIAADKGTHFDTGQGRLMKEWLMLDTMSAEEWLSLSKEAMEFVNSK